MIVRSHRNGRLPMGVACRIPTTRSYQELGTSVRDARTMTLLTLHIQTETLMRD